MKINGEYKLEGEPQDTTNWGEYNKWEYLHNMKYKMEGFYLDIGYSEEEADSMAIDWVRDLESEIQGVNKKPSEGDELIEYITN